MHLKLLREAREQVPAEMATPRRGAAGRTPRPGAPPPEMVIQGDFRKVSGISTEIFNQIQAVENDHDATTAASLEAVEKRGEMVIRLLDIRTMGKAAAEQARRFLTHDPNFVVRFVEIVKRPGQTLGLYIREGNGIDRHDGVFLSRIALESAVANSGCLHVGDEILAVNLVDVTNVSLDDVVIIMSIPRRLVLTTRARKFGKGPRALPLGASERKAPPVVVMKKELQEEEPQDESNSNGENGVGPGGVIAAAHLLPGYGLDAVYVEPRGLEGSMIPAGAYLPQEEQYLYYNSQPAPAKYRATMVPVGRVPGMGMTVREPPREAWIVQEPGPSGYTTRVVTEQPRPLHPYPETLESLAEGVHSFYAGARPGRPPPPTGAPTAPRVMRPSRSDRSLARRGHPHAATGGRMLRAESEQRLSAPREAPMHPHYEAATLGRPLRSSLKHSPSTQLAAGFAIDRATGRYTDAMQRLSALRRRVATDPSFSDTEAQTMPRASILARQGSLDKAARAHAHALRSNSLPRMRSDAHDRYYRRHRHTVRFEREPLPPTGDSQEDSDGALSAPELPLRRERVRIPSSPSVFTAAEYRAWLNRAPSTSAIYEKLKKSREVLHAQRAARVTYSAENLLDRRGEEQPFHYRTYAARPLSRDLHGESTSSLSTSATMAPSSRRVRYLLDDGRHIPNPTPAKPSEFRVRLVDINPAEFLKYKPDREPLPTPAEERAEPPAEELAGAAGEIGAAAARGGFSGLLWVHLLAGRGLKASGRSGHYRDLYCVLECDHVHKARTVVRTGDQNFDWDETFELDLLHNRELDFLIYSWDPRFRHKLCYKGSVHLPTLLRESPLHQLALKIEPRGTLYVKLRYTEPRRAFQRVPAPRKSALFGVDLDSVVSRENSPFLAPLVVKRCLEEVERRGLDIIGLYRLCGSATKKRMLRDAFERNPLRVDTSPDSVPDINVITGVLKDYLRELPEPLFTKCLNQMLVDALSVCLPEDPEGGAKLVFSILDCLPKYNRCTLIMLMDHLKLVVSQSERNKMNAQNIAVVFGPILMVHTDATSTSVDFNTPVQVLKYLLEIWPAKQESSGSEESQNGQNGGQPPSQEEKMEPQEETEAAARGSTTPSTQDAGAKSMVTWSGQRVLPESSC